MNTTTSAVESAPGKGILNEIQICILCLTTTLIIHFASAPYFFLYEDDYYHVGVPASQSLIWVWEQVKIVWQTWPQGRPGMFMTPAFLGSLIHMTGSVVAGYIPIFLIVSANGYLSYRLFSLRLPQTASLVGALFCLVSCADPHKILLTHTTLQIAITLNLVGLILYLNDRPVLGYVIAGSSLLFYEISFAIFACAELIYCINGRINWRRLLLTWSAWLGVAGAVFAIRFFVGETRATEAAGNLSELGRRIVANVTWGPVYGLQNSYTHPLGLIFDQPHVWPLVLSVVAVLGFGLFVLRMSKPHLGGPSPRPALNMLAASTVLLLLTFGPYAMQLKRTVFPGFMRPVSGYHLCLGLALGFGVALLLARCAAFPRWTKTIYVVTLFLGCTSAYQNLLIQYDYARSARYQAHFWAEIQRTSPDAEPGDVILIPNQHLLESEYILSNSWGIAHAWLVLFKQTGPLKDWANVPAVRPVTVFLVSPDWESRIALKEDGYSLPHPDYTPPGFRTGVIPLLDGHVIILDGNFAEPFHRRTQPIITAQGPILLKVPPAHGPQNLPYTKVAKYLFNNFIN